MIDNFVCKMSENRENYHLNNNKKESKVTSFYILFCSSNHPKQRSNQFIMYDKEKQNHHTQKTETGKYFLFFIFKNDKNDY